MSSKRVKRETVDVVIPDHSDNRNGVQADTASEYDRLKKEVAHKNEVITALEEFVGKMQRGLCCGICTELLYQPFNLACGHVFCYSCLVDWFKEAKRCPTCRERIVDKPAVSYLIKEMVNSYVRRAEIVDPDGTGARYYKEQAEADKAVRDANGNLFPGLFFKLPHATNRIVDETDGVTRCIRCNWEVEGPTCMHCGLTFSDEEDPDFGDMEDEEDEDEDDSEDEEEDDDDDDQDYYSPDEDYDIDAQIMAMEALGHYPYDSQEISEEEGEDDDEMDEDDDEPPPLWDESAGYRSGEEEDHDEDEDDSDEDEDEDEDDSVMEVSDPIPSEDDDEENDSDESIPYHPRANNYYNRIDSSMAQDDDTDDDEEEAQPEVPQRSRTYFVVKSSDEESSDHTARQTRSMRRARNNVVDSDDD